MKSEINSQNTYRCSRVQLLLLPLEHHIIHLVFLKLLLAAVQQQFAKVHCGVGFVCHGHFELHIIGRHREKEVLKEVK